MICETACKPEVSNIDQAEALANNVLKQLGRPGRLRSCQAKPVGGNRFRVNVVATVSVPYGLQLVEQDLITDSFYIEAGQGGEIIRSSPAIERKYD